MYIANDFNAIPIENERYGVQEELLLFVMRSGSACRVVNFMILAFKVLIIHGNVGKLSNDLIE